jgi:hypothetical protein
MNMAAHLVVVLLLALVAAGVEVRLVAVLALVWVLILWGVG